MEYHATFDGEASPEQRHRLAALKKVFCYLKSLDLDVNDPRRQKLLPEADIALPYVTHPTPEPRDVKQYQLRLPHTEVPCVSMEGPV